MRLERAALAHRHELAPGAGEAESRVEQGHAEAEADHEEQGQLQAGRRGHGGREHDREHQAGDEGDPLDGWSRGRRRRGAALGAEGVGDAGQQGHVFSWLVGRVGWPHGWLAAVEMGESR